jgi:hypothetical protein
MTPLLDDLVAKAGGRLVAAREIHPTFDEVFTTLVERDSVAREAMVAQEGGGEDQRAAFGGEEDPRSAGPEDDDVAGAA